MPYTTTDETAIYFEVSGDPDRPVVVLIAGGGAQLLSWHEDFVAQLVSAGLTVVRLDNRDTGLSARFGGPEDVDGGYDMGDMADDVIRVLDTLGVGAAHLVGHSMGGIIAQMAALRHPGRVLSLGLISTLPGKNPSHILHDDPVLEPAAHFPLEQLVEFAAEYTRNDSTGLYDPQEQWHRDKAVRAFERGYFPDGFTRQWSAMLRAPERIELLPSVTIPAFVMHGRDDGVLHFTGGIAIAQALPNAELQVYPGMGHLIPRELWPELGAGILRAVARSGAFHP